MRRSGLTSFVLIASVAACQAGALSSPAPSAAPQISPRPSAEPTATPTLRPTATPLLPTAMPLPTPGAHPGTWAPVQGGEKLWGFTQTALAGGGKVLLLDTGGWICEPEYNGPEAAAFVYDPKTALLRPTSAPSRSPGDITPLHDGRIIASGIFRGPEGWEDEPSGYAIWSPKSGAWSSVSQGADGGGLMVTLADGRVLLAGGSSGQDLTDMAQLYDPTDGRWNLTGSMPTTFDELRMVALAGGGAIAVGADYVGDRGPVAAIFDSASGTWSEVPGPPGGDFRVSLVATMDGTALAFGASGTINRFDPVAGWRGAGQLLVPRQKPAVVVLGNGMVMVAGGAVGGTGSVAVDLYDPATATSSLIAELPSPRDGGSLVALGDGSVLLAGGFVGPESDEGSLQCLAARDRALRWTPEH